MLIDPGFRPENYRVTLQGYAEYAPGDASYGGEGAGSGAARCWVLGESSPLCPVYIGFRCAQEAVSYFSLLFSPGTVLAYPTRDLSLTTLALRLGRPDTQ